MTCCNHECRQGRDCPNRPPRELTLIEITFAVALASTLLLLPLLFGVFP